MAINGLEVFLAIMNAVIAIGCVGLFVFLIVKVIQLSRRGRRSEK